MSTTKAIVGGASLVVVLSIGAYLVNSSRAPSAAAPRPSATAVDKSLSRSRIHPEPPADAVPQITAPKAAAATAITEASNEFAREFAQLLSAPNSGERRARLRPLLIAWGKVAPHDALAAVQRLGLSALEKESHDLDVFTGWAASDPEGAWLHAPRTVSAQAAVRSEFRVKVSRQPIDGTFNPSLDDPYRWQNPTQNASPPANPFFQKIAVVMAENGRAAEALKLLTDEPDDRFRLSTVSSMISSMVKNNVEGAIALVRSIPPYGPWRAATVAVVAGDLAREFPDLAFDFAGGFPDVQAQALSSVFAELGRVGNARVTADWIARQPSPNLRERALRYYFGIQGEMTDPIRAAAQQKLELAVAK